MGVRAKAAPKATAAVHAVIALDPAGVGPCGLAGRATSGLVSKGSRTPKLAPPAYCYEGPVFNTRMHDELTDWLYRSIPPNGKVLLVTEGTAYGNKVARSLGRAIGCIEGLLLSINVWAPGETQYVTAGTWRQVLELETKPEGRDAQKAAAVAYVADRYGMKCGPDLAEATAICDWVIRSRPSWWGPGKVAA